MFFYTTGDYESKYGETLEKFAERIATSHVNNEFGEPRVEFISVIFNSEITLPDEALEQFQKKVESYYHDEVQNSVDEQAYRDECAKLIYERF